MNAIGSERRQQFTLSTYAWREIKPVQELRSVSVCLGLINYDCVVGASAASFFADPAATYSLGASGAVFGLFAVAVLLKLRFNFQKLVECLVLGQFVVKQVLQVRHPSMQQGLSMSINSFKSGAGTAIVTYRI